MSLRVRKTVSIRRLWTVSTASLLAAALVATALGCAKLARTLAAIESDETRAAMLRADVDARLSAMLNQEVGLRGYLATGDERFLEPYESGLRDALRLRARLAAGLRDDERDAIALALDGELDAARRWRADVAEPQLAARRLDAVLDLPAMLRTGKERFDRYRAAHDDLRSALDRVTALHARRRHNELAELGAVILAVLGGFILVGAALSRSLVRRTVRPIVALSHAAERGEVSVDVVRGVQLREIIVLADTMARLFRVSQERAIRDGLTRAYNRGFLAEWLPRQLRLLRRTRGHLAVLMVDVDHFKKINDTFGHAAGDQVLVALARCMEQQLRASDVVVRYGGEEFTVFLPDTAVAGGYVTAERLRAAIAAMTEREGLPTGLRITASIGLAAIGAGGDGARLVERADAALYEAKRGGRNRVVAATPPREASQEEDVAAAVAEALPIAS